MSPKDKTLVNRYSIPILLFLFVGILIRDTYGHKWDNDLFRAWALHDYQQGLSKAYYSDTNYLPLYHYLLYGYAWLLGSAETIVEWFSCVHMVTFLFDMVGIWFIYKWTDKRYDFNTLLILLVLNPGYSYNTLIWGQVDGILATLLFASLYFAWKEKMVPAAVFFVLAINMKLQAIVFLPVFGLLYLSDIATKRNRKVIVMPFVAAVIAQFIILLPFIIEWAGLPLLWNVVGGSVGKWPFISLHAYNLWYLVYTDPRFMADEALFLWGLTHKQFGLVLFFAGSLAALLPLAMTVWRRYVDRAAALIDRRQLWLTAAIVNMLFFYFNTQMHERYCHPVLIFIAAYAYYTKDFFPFVLFSVTYCLSLERVLQWLELNVKNKELLIFSPVLLSLLYAVVMVYLVWRLVVIAREGERAEKDLDKPRKAYPKLIT